MGGSQFINEDAGDFVILEDRFGSEFVALGELRGMFSPPLERSGKISLEASMIRVLITGVQRRDTILPKPVVDGFGRVLCRIVGKAYEMRVEVWWYETNTVISNEDGCTHSSF
jgi:hypothetical protein